MKKSLLSLLLTFAFLTDIQAQTTNSFFLGIGGAYTDFQDIKYSEVPYAGGGFAFNIGFEKENANSIWETGLFINAGSEGAATHDKASVLAINPKLYFRFLKKTSDRFSIGAHWDIINFYLRSDSYLGNNGTYYLSSSDLLLATNYRYKKFDFGLDLGLLSFKKEGTSFAFSAPQGPLEDGEFDYQNEQLENPFGAKYYGFDNVFNHLLLRTNIRYQLGKRFEVGYQWSMRHFAEVKKHPVTMGAHNVTIRWNFIHRTKERVESN